MTQLLPDGVLPPGHHILAFEDEERGEPRGVLSFAEREHSGRRTGTCTTSRSTRPIGVAASAASDALFERLAVELGAEDADRAVFGGNAAALSLYESLGYRVTARLMRKPLRQPPAP